MQSQFLIFMEKIYSLCQNTSSQKHFVSKLFFFSKTKFSFFMIFISPIFDNLSSRVLLRAIFAPFTYSINITARVYTCLSVLILRNTNLLLLILTSKSSIVQHLPIKKKFQEKNEHTCKCFMYINVETFC